MSADEALRRGFTYQAHPARVVFGAGTVGQVGAEVERLGCRRALVLSTPQQEQQARGLAASLGGLAAGVHPGAVLHTPVEATLRALDVLRQAGADCVVALGGGSTTGLGKALAVRTGLPQVVVPTTYAGSEATDILGETENGRKTTRRSPDILPEVIVYDVDLTLSLPPALSVSSGINAMAHAVEALYAPDASPVVSALAAEGIAAFARALPAIVADPADREARADALCGAWLCGTCLGAVAMGLHHKLCHVLGGTFDLPHAETHTVVLPYAAAYNAAHAPAAMARVARALNTADAPGGLAAFARSLGAPASLRDIGMPPDGIGRAVELACAQPYPNPRPVEPGGIRALLLAALDGAPPADGRLTPSPAENSHA